jgi:Transposase and inactivated derivatives
VIEIPRFYEHSQSRIKKIQRSLAWKQRFSKNWKKAKKRLEKVYDHVTNQKKDFLHKLSRQYVDTYATICVEDLNIKCLKENGKFRGLR